MPTCQTSAVRISVQRLTNLQAAYTWAPIDVNRAMQFTCEDPKNGITLYLMKHHHNGALATVKHNLWYSKLRKAVHAARESISAATR